MIRIFLISILMIFLSGCISITKELPAYHTYNLEYKTAPSSNLHFDKSIKILEPRALASLNSIAISYKKDGFINDSYVTSKWSDKPSKMIEQSIASYLASKNSYRYITTSNLKLDSDYTMYGELFEFNQSFEGEDSYALFNINIYLKDDKNENIAYKNFSYKIKTDTNDAIGFVKTINIIFNTFLSDLNLFVEKNLNHKS